MSRLMPGTSESDISKSAGADNAALDMTNEQRFDWACGHNAGLVLEIFSSFSAGRECAERCQLWLDGHPNEGALTFASVAVLKWVHHRNRQLEAAELAGRIVVERSGR